MPVAAVVAEALQHTSERRLARPEIGATTVVLEAGNHARPVAEVSLNRTIADQPRAGFAHRVQVHEPDAGQPLAIHLVLVAEQLVSAANSQHDGTAAGGGMKRLLLGLDHVVRTQRLVAILSAAHVEEIVRVRVHRLVDRRARELEADPAPLAAGAEQLHVAAVRVDVHELGIQRAHAQLHEASRITTLLPVHSVLSGIQPRSRAAKPQSAASASSWSALTRSSWIVATRSLISPAGETDWRWRSIAAVICSRLTASGVRA